MDLGLESFVSESNSVSPCTYEDVLLSQQEVADTFYNLSTCMNTFTNLVDILDHINKFGITEENKALFASSFESIGLSFSNEDVIATIKNTISRIREWILVFIQKIKELFAKFSADAKGKIAAIDKKIAEIRTIEQKYRFDNIARTVSITIHYLDSNLIDTYIRGDYSKKLESLSEAKRNIIKSREAHMREWETECESAKELYAACQSTINNKQSAIEKQIKELNQQLDEAVKKVEGTKTESNEIPSDRFDKAILNLSIQKLEKQRDRCVAAMRIVNEFGMLINEDIEAIKKKAYKIIEKIK